MTALREHLRDLAAISTQCGNWAGSFYNGPHDLLLREGQDMVRTAPYDAARWGRPGSMGRCFANAFLLACDHDELTYVEGWAAGLLPVHHGWCVDQSGAVVDPTWVEEPFTATEYLGIAFPAWYVFRHCPGLLDDWQGDFPVCRRPLSEQLAAVTA